MLGFSGIVQQEDWARFESYASRVRQIDEEGEISIENVVFIRTAQYLQGRPMFPSLISLSLSDFPIILPLLVSPSLLAINILQDNPSGSQTALIQSICDGAPSLESFGFCGNLEGNSFKLLSQLPYLHHLFIIGDVIPVDSIASFKSLTELYLQTKISEPFHHGHRKPFGLQDLRNLTIVAPPKFVIFMLKAFSESPLQNLNCTVTQTQNGAVTLAEWTDAISIISSWASTLCRVRLGCIRSTTTIIEGFSYLQDLLSCHQLERLVVRNNFTTLLSDDDFTRLSAAWPNLEELVLEGDLPTVLDPLATKASLNVIAKCLPKLRVLDVPLNLGGISLREPRLLASHQLKSINFERVFYDHDLIPLAHLLDGLFPSLEVGDECQTAASTEPEESIQMLKNLLFLCQDARANRLEMVE
ncbi:uncharacterized protein LACBIDRAFT_328577 [Laccaria bicolor S238N-H82]|uniref:Predicted protein n=1 Tax=Laccaria bicolor (strain S238N-H82 / ATCC MYA-4686) TaxID=486041 RepID=B0DFB9_LACBS|nr:uncharacterized protein LACBIDRAFT_328577 [Laccaria bicolor S238N-H82]EDR06678.1 predicted protein [Laccaria bicolor S238N-H82]|eukprot:XP_001882525.1 predicted protein [Laccaria bicolor S238N-H82]